MNPLNTITDIEKTAAANPDIKMTARGPVLKQQVYARRRKNFISRLAPNSVAIFVSNPESTRSNDTEYKYRQSSDILYLTGFPEPESVVVLSNIADLPSFTMLVREKDRAQEIWTGIRAGVEGAKSKYKAKQAYGVGKFSEVLKDMLSKATHVYYKFNRNSEFDTQFQKLWSDTQKPLLNPEDILHEMRLFKGAEEIEIMRHAAAISARGHCLAMALCEKVEWESDLEAILEFVFRKNKADAPAYGSIVAGSNNAVILHYTENASRLRKGKLVLIDAACEYQGYATDITRTFPVKGKFSKAEREIYQLVLDAQLAAIAAAKPGVKLADVHAVAANVLAAGLVELGILPASSLKLRKKPKGKSKRLTLLDFFMHGTSHWMGLDVHDVGSYATADGTRSDKGKGKQRVLEPGMVITVEPGLYIDAKDERVPKKYRGIGVRIEDDIVITADGNEVITDGAPKTVEDIEALMSCLQLLSAQIGAAQAE